MNNYYIKPIEKTRVEEVKVLQDISVSIDGQRHTLQSAEELDRRIRALNPIPSSNCFIKKELVKVFEAEIVKKIGKPGTLLDDEFLVACGKDALRLLKIQRPGKKITQAREALRGWKIRIGDKLS